MRKDLRVAYLSSLGFREVQTINALEAVLKENEIDKVKLGKICEHYQIPAQYRCRVWKIMLGVVPQFQETWEFIQAQKESQYADLKQACELVDSQAHSMFHKVKWSAFSRKTKLQEAKNINSAKGLSPSPFSPALVTPLPPSAFSIVEPAEKNPTIAVENSANLENNNSLTPNTKITPPVNIDKSKSPNTPVPIFSISGGNPLLPTEPLKIDETNNNEEKNKKINNDNNNNDNNNISIISAEYSHLSTTPLKRTISGTIHSSTPKNPLSKSPKHKSSPSFSPSAAIFSQPVPTNSNSSSMKSFFSKNPLSPFSSTPTNSKTPMSSTPTSAKNSPFSSTPNSAKSTPLATPSTTPTTTPTTSPTLSRPSPPPSPYPPDLEVLLTDAANMLSLLFSTKRSYFDLSSSPSSPETVRMDDEMCIHSTEEFKDDSGHITAIAKVFCAICDTEMDAFWCFHDFMNQPLQTYGNRTTVIYRYISILARLLEGNDVEMWQHFKAVDLKLEHFAYCWFKSYFTGCFSMPSLAIIWDKLIGISMECMPHIAFAILQALRRRILRRTDAHAIINMLVFPNVAVESFIHKAVDLYTAAPTPGDEYI